MVGLSLVGDGQVLPLEGQRDFLLGRLDPSRDIRPEIDLTPLGGVEAGVSRRHAAIRVRAGVWLIEDLKSANHTYVNGRRIPAHTPYALRHGDEIRLGKLTLTFRMEEGSAE